MADLSKYTAQILTEDDRLLFHEAEICASHGALRGAYVLVWIACAEGLKRKFREAVVRDGKVNKIIDRITQAESNHHSVDLTILKEAKNYGFIGDGAFQKLEHVYTMRCVYGHPYEAAPRDEELASAAAVVVGEVLGKPTLLRLCWRMTPGIAERSCNLLRLQSRMPGQAHEVGLTCLATRSLGQNGINAHQIDRDSGQDMLHLRFTQAVIACASDAHASYGLGKRGLDSCSGLIRLPKLS